jgi:hypothetical protein
MKRKSGLHAVKKHPGGKQYRFALPSHQQMKQHGRGGQWK